MAVEEPLEEEEGPPAGAPKKAGSKVLLLVAIGVLLLALIGVGGYLAYTQFASGGDESPPAAEGEASGEKPKEEASKDDAGAKLGEMMALPPFIVNLSGESGKRYLKIAIQVELSNSTLAEEVGNKMPQLKDSIITVLSSKTSDELLTIEGKFSLKEQLLTRVNALLTTGVAKNIYFVEFVIQ